MSLLSKAKQNLIEHATQLWSDRRHDIAPSEYPDHYKDLGEVIMSIEVIQTLGHLVAAMEAGQYEVLGYFIGEEDTMQEFLESLGK